MHLGPRLLPDLRRGGPSSLSACPVGRRREWRRVEVSAPCTPVAVVVVTWNSARLLDGCLGSLRDLARPPAEVVLVDSGSDDGTVGIAKERFPDVAVVECGCNVGFCRASNLGI